MPYEVKEENGEYCVYNKDTQDNKGCHENREDAERQIRLLHEIEREGDE
jgi:hypothetical protein